MTAELANHLSCQTLSASPIPLTPTRADVPHDDLAVRAAADELAAVARAAHVEATWCDDAIARLRIGDVVAVALVCLEQERSVGIPQLHQPVPPRRETVLPVTCRQSRVSVTLGCGCCGAN